MAADIVAGLRILRGIGGEKTFGDNYATQSQRVRRLGVTAGTWQAVVETLSVLLSGLLLVILVWLGSHEMMAGRLTLGQLIPASSAMRSSWSGRCRPCSRWRRSGCAGWCRRARPSHC